MNSHTVIIADPDTLTCTAVRERLERGGIAVGCASDGAGLLSLVAGAEPDAVVVDVRLEDMNGYEACRELREKLGESLCIILMSADRTDPLDRSVALLLGADEYMTKPLDLDELVARVRRAIARRQSGPAGSARWPRPAADHRPAVLTPRELDVLQLLAQGLRQRQIAEELVVTEKTVSSHLEHILEKLGVHSRAEAVVAAFRRGIVAQPLGAADSIPFPSNSDDNEPVDLRQMRSS